MTINPNMNKDRFIDFANECIRGNPWDLRLQGITVAVHNDYRERGEFRTFWLVTFQLKGLPMYLKGEGKSDGDALDQIRAQYAKLTDHLHHAPLCPANHMEGQRAPTGNCTCGAVAMEKEK